MTVSLYKWYGPLRADSGLYEKDEDETDPMPHAYLTIDRGNDSVDVWIYSREEAEAILVELEKIRDHVEPEAKEARI